MEVKPKAWLRLYAEVVNDPKVQMLPGDVFKLWINLLCIARQSDGIIHESRFKQYCWTLRIDEQSLRHAIIHDLAELLDEVEDGQWMPHGWTKRQYESDSSTERSRQFRERQKQQQGDVSSETNAPDQSQSLQRSGNVPCNDNATLQQRPQRQNTETETETDTNTNTPQEIEASAPDGAVALEDNSHWSREGSQIPPIPGSLPQKSRMIERTSKYDCLRKIHADFLPVAEWFESMYALHPKKTSAKSAWEATLSVFKRKGGERWLTPELMETIRGVHRAFVETDRQWLAGYVPHFETWVRGEGWEGEPDAGKGQIVTTSSSRRLPPPPLPPVSERADAINASLNHILEHGDMFGPLPGTPAARREAEGMATRR